MASEKTPFYAFCSKRQAKKCDRQNCTLHIHLQHHNRGFWLLELRWSMNYVTLTIHNFYKLLRRDVPLLALGLLFDD